MTTHNDDGFARNLGRVIEKEDEHIDDIIMTKIGTGSDDFEDDDDRCERETGGQCLLQSALPSLFHLSQ